MTILRGIVTIAASAVIFALGGGAIGYVLGHTAPGYYRTVFRSGHRPGFEPTEVGLGLGITQGLFCGLLIGIFVVLIVGWLGRPRGEASDSPLRTSAGMSPGLRWFLLLVTLGGTLLVGSSVGFLAGAIAGQSQLYNRYAHEKIERIRPLLRGAEYSNLEVDYSSAAQVYLTGTVESRAAYDRLEERLRLMFGDEEADFMLRPVDVTEQQ